MKEIYESPVIEVIEYEAEDVITTSAQYGDNDFSILDKWNRF